MKKFAYICCGLAFLLVISACDKKGSEPTTQTTEATPTAQTESTAQAPVAMPPATQPSVKTGKVKETMNTAGYTYILVADDSSETWIAVTETTVNVGDEVSYYDGIVMENFQSKTLNRSFDKIVFSSGLVGQGAALAGGTLPVDSSGVPPASSFGEALKTEGGGLAAPPPGMEGALGSKAAVVPFTEIHVDKADGENSYTVSELFAKAAELNGKTIKIKGKIVKVSRRIMGVNWLHIQDGTGDPAGNTHDLVVTTDADPQDGWDIVTAEGVLAANKDFGAGYKYDVIIEQAQISK